MEEQEFGLQLENDKMPLSDFVSEENEKVASLRDWQRRAIDFYFDHNGHAIFEVTTGAGKTFGAIEIIKEVWKKEGRKVRVLIVVPKNVILESGWYKELYDAGISLTDIGVYYAGIKEYGTITLTNMQNLDRIAIEIFDMVIYDEVHNYGTERMLEFVKIPCKYKLGLTATIERMDGNHYELYKHFNYNVFKYASKEALDDDVLNAFDFINIGVYMDDESYEEYMELTQEINTMLLAGGGYGAIMRTTTGLKLKMLGKMNERKVLVNNYSSKFDIANIIVNKHKNDKVIIFNQFNEQTTKLYWYLLDIGMNARVFHSGIDKQKRDQTLMDFKNDKFNVLLTTKVLDEGYNLPKIDTAIIMAGDSTAKQTIQRMGRVLRKKDKRSTLYQIYCINTMEETQGEKRAEMFKQLSSDYREYTYAEGDELIL